MTGCTQTAAENGAAMPLGPTTTFQPTPTPLGHLGGPFVSGTVWKVQISPEQIFLVSLNISAGDTVVFVNMNQYGTKTLAFDDGYPSMTLRFMQRANRTFSEPGRYTYRDAVRGDEAEVNVG